VYKSDDGGETWRHRISTRRANALSIDPANPQVIVAAVSDGVIRSADGGETWRAADGLPAKDMSSLLRAPTGVMYVSDWEDCSHLYRSADGGATWSRVDIIEILLASPLDRCPRGAGRTLRLLAVDPNAPATLYASVSFSGLSGLLRSSDGGVSWRPAGLPRSVLSLALTPSSLYAGTIGGGVCRSDDRGLTWRAASDGLTGFDIFALAVDPTTPTTLYASTDNGVHKSDDGGLTWRAVGLPGQSVWSAGRHPDHADHAVCGRLLWRRTRRVQKRGRRGNLARRRVARAANPDAGGRSDHADHAVCRRPGRGRAPQRRWRRETWRAVGLPGRSVRALAIHPIEPATLFAGTNDNGDNALFRSTDGGATWSESVRTGYGGITAVVIDPNAPETVYATSEIGLLRSTDGGATWSRNLIALTRFLFAEPRSLLLVTDPAQPPTIYVGTLISGVWRQAIDKARWEPYP
jgi:photosystem II stability/assembly factor-like uncharacterized protein